MATDSELKYLGTAKYSGVFSKSLHRQRLGVFGSENGRVGHLRLRLVSGDHISLRVPKVIRTFRVSPFYASRNDVH